LPDGRIFGQIAQNRPQNIYWPEKLVAVKQHVFFSKTASIEAGKYFRQKIMRENDLFYGISSASRSKKSQ
jgi:hypothetical protein